MSCFPLRPGLPGKEVVVTSFSCGAEALGIGRKGHSSLPWSEADWDRDEE